jgi:hypothetical protein
MVVMNLKILVVEGARMLVDLCTVHVAVRPGGGRNKRHSDLDGSRLVGDNVERCFGTEPFRCIVYKQLDLEKFKIFHFVYCIL